MQRISYILLVLMLSQTFGFVVYFENTKSKIRKEMKTRIKQGVPKEDLHDFEFTELEYKNLTWTKHDEFKLGIEYYDVVWFEKLENGNIHVSCVNDKDETILFASLTQQVNFNLSDSKSNNPIRVVFTILQMPSILNSMLSRIDLRNEKLQKNSVFSYKENQSIEFISKFFPPPELKS
jgi:hypothetical protein